VLPATELAVLSWRDAELALSCRPSCRSGKWERAARCFQALALRLADREFLALLADGGGGSSGAGQVDIAGRLEGERRLARLAWAVVAVFCIVSMAVTSARAPTPAAGGCVCHIEWRRSVSMLPAAGTPQRPG
jgi:hypothetical protein